MKKLLTIMLLISVFFCVNVYAVDFEEETVSFGGYCYYIENGDIYRAPMTDMAGETELFREKST